MRRGAGCGRTGPSGAIDIGHEPGAHVPDEVQGPADDQGSASRRGQLHGHLQGRVGVIDGCRGVSIGGGRPVAE